MAETDHDFIRALLPAWVEDDERLLDGLEEFEALIRKWNQAQNLVSRETLPDIWQRHFGDSLQLLTLMNDSPAHLLDLGSGGGFPAIPLALASPGTRFTLVDSNQKKAAFLREAARQLKLDVEVLCARVEIFDTGSFPDLDLITSRGFAPLKDLFGYCAPLWKTRTRALFHKGRQYRSEVAEALSQWRCDLVEHKSLIETDSVILDIQRLEARR